MSLPSSRPSSISPEPIGYVPPPRQLPLQGALQAGPDVHFTVFIRVPFPRRAFIDPQPVDWDASKDRALWKILSRTSKSGNIDWRALAEQFDVTLPFLLQQAAWLYERQLSQVRAQMRKVNTKHSVAPSPVPGSVSGSATAGGHATRRAGSGAAGSRVPSSLSMRTKDSPVPSNEGGVAGSSLKSKAPRLSRTSSTHATPSNRRDLVSSLRHPINQQGHEKNAPHGDARKEPQPGTIPTQSGVQHGEQVATSPSAKADSSSSSSSSDSEPAEQISKSQTFKRRPRFSSTTAPAPRFEDGEGDDGDDEDPPAFLPFSNPAPPDAHDPSATLRIHTPSRSAQCQAAPSQPTTRQWSQTTHSSASSGSSAAAAGTQVDGAQSQRPSGPLSPRRAAELAALSPRRRTLAKEGSDGTPSMGSSFSDLDDASVTQSALEEALLSNMQHGGVASRMSTISQALKSRYL